MLCAADVVPGLPKGVYIYEPVVYGNVYRNHCKAFVRSTSCDWHLIDDAAPVRELNAEQLIKLCDDGRSQPVAVIFQLLPPPAPVQRPLPLPTRLDGPSAAATPAAGPVKAANMEALLLKVRAMESAVSESTQRGTAQELAVLNIQGFGETKPLVSTSPVLCGVIFSSH